MNRPELVQALDQASNGEERMQLFENALGTGWDDLLTIFCPPPRMRMTPETRITQAEIAMLLRGEPVRHSER